MKIFQILNSLECGGLEKLTLDLSIKLKARGHILTICCLEGSGNLLNSSHAGIEIISFNRKSGLDFILPFRLAGAISQRKPDVVHTHNPGPLLYGTIAAKLAGVSVVINTRHGRAPRHTNRYIWDMNDAIVAISRDAQTELFKNNTVDQGKVSVIYNGIDTDLFTSAVQLGNEKEVLGLASSHVIGTVSRLSWEKDQSSLIKAFAIVATAEPKAKLVFVGDGPLKNSLVTLAKDLGLQDNVVFLGFRNDVSDVMRAFDIFVLSSLQEGISLSLLEAMASGKPAVVTNVGGNPEVVVDGETGILVPPQDPKKMAAAIIKIIKDTELSQKNGKFGRAKVEKEFGLDRMATEYEELYKRCVKKNKDRTAKIKND